VRTSAKGSRDRASAAFRGAVGSRAAAGEPPVQGGV